jgi:chromosome segregation ATPase
MSSTTKILDKLSQIDNKVDGLQGQINVLNNRVETLNDKFDGLQGQVNGLNDKFEGLNDKFEALDCKVDAIADVQERMLVDLVDVKLNVQGLNDWRGHVDAKLDHLTDSVDGIAQSQKDFECEQAATHNRLTRIEGVLELA